MTSRKLLAFVVIASVSGMPLLGVCLAHGPEQRLARVE